MFSSIHHPRGRRLLAVAATLAALTGAAAATNSVASAQARSSNTTTTSTAAGVQLEADRHHQHQQGKHAKPTVVFVHGGWADSSGWNAEIAALQEKGYPVIAPANPLRGLSSDADYVRSVLQTIDGPIVLVGHSYGGAVISNAARGVDNVKALVYIAAFAPDTGESLAQLVNQEPGHPHHPRRPDRTALPAARRHPGRRPLHQGRGLPRRLRWRRAPQDHRPDVRRAAPVLGRGVHRALR